MDHSKLRIVRKLGDDRQELELALSKIWGRQTGAATQTTTHPGGTHKASILLQVPTRIRIGIHSARTSGYRGDKEGYLIPQGTDIFISVYNLHRSPYLWDNPHKFEPERFLVPKENKDIEGWAGFSPYRNQGALYPNEVISDFAFLPFGGGPRKCVGDQFALMEATVALAMLLQKFDLKLKGSPESVQIVTGATIHTKNGLWCKIKRREGVQLENIVS